MKTSLPTLTRIICPNGKSSFILGPPSLAKHVGKRCLPVSGILLESDQVGPVLIFVMKASPKRSQSLLAVEELFIDLLAGIWRIDHSSV